MKLPHESAFTLLSILLLGGCTFHKTIFPPPYIGSPQEIGTFEVKGLIFATTVSFNGMFAEEHIRQYAKKNHYRYYVVTMRRNDTQTRSERMTAMLYW